MLEGERKKIEHIPEEIDTPKDKSGETEIGVDPLGKSFEPLESRPKRV